MSNPLTETQEASAFEVLEHAMTKPLVLSVLKYGIGYDLVVDASTGRLVLGIRCHRCTRVSFQPTDITERYCGACHVFHEEHLLDHQG